MPRLTADQWADVRAEWEGEPTATFNALADKHGINVSNISRKADKEGWAKRNQLGVINESASRKADAMVDSDGNANPKRKTQNQPAKLALAQREQSEDVRALVQARHRQEWAELEQFRKAALAQMKAAHEGSKAWREAKIAAETAATNIRALDIKQQGEARAWMLDFKGEADIVISNPRATV